MSTKKLILAATLALCGVAYAASPLLQGPMQPTEHHERVLKGAGHWEGSISMWMPGATEPTKSRASEHVTTIGDMWTTSRFETNLMGMPFVGASTLGYDPNKGKYVGTWIDAMNPALTVMEGHWDEEKKAIVMEYQSMDAMAGGMVDMRSYTMHSGDKYECKFFRVQNGEESLQMEISMTRKPAAQEASAAK